MNGADASMSGDTVARLRALFEACIELEPVARADFLRAQDLPAALRSRLDALLAADHSGDGMLATPAAAWADRLHPSPADAEAMVGALVGGFRIVALLGEGGSAVVFRAEREVAGTTQVVALKLLRSGLYSSEGQRRFRRELDSLAQLSHPNIAHLIDAGISATGAPWIATELVEGLPLTEHAQRHGIDLAARLRLLGDLCRAVDSAHRALVVHRDLKPSNVLVSSAGEVKVVDFGIAKTLGDPTETATLHIALTPGYAAPEQYRRGPVTTAADVYALGVIGAELLVGVRLGPDATLPRDSADADALRRRWSALDPDLATWLRTALAEDPGQRYASARHAADDIERFLRHEPIAARAPSRRYRAGKFVRRHRAAVVTGAAFMLALLGALGMALRQAAIARTQAARADTMRDFMFEAFTEAEPSVPRNGPATVLDAAHRAIASSADDRGGEPAARIELRTRLAQLLLRQGDLAGARELYAQTLDEATRTLGSGDPLTLALVQLSAEAAMLRGDFAASRAAIEGLLARLGDDHGDSRIQALSLSAVLATKLNEPGRALADGREAVALARALGDAEVLRQTLNDFGVVLLGVDALPEAVQVYEEVLAINRARFGERHQKTATVLGALARAYRRVGDLPRAEQSARAALAIDGAIYPGDDRRTALHLNALMKVLEAKGDAAAARDVARESLRMNRAVLGEDHPESLNALAGMAALEVECGDAASAAALLGAALQRSELHPGADRAASAGLRADYGHALALDGQAATGISQLERAIAELDALAEPNPDRLASALAQRLRLALAGHDGATATRLLERLQQLAATAPPSRASWAGNLDVLRGALQLSQRQPALAVESLERAGTLLATTAGASITLRAEQSLLLAQALAAAGQAQRAVDATREARKLLAALPFTPPRLRELDAALALPAGASR